MDAALDIRGECHVRIVALRDLLQRCVTLLVDSTAKVVVAFVVLVRLLELEYDRRLAVRRHHYKVCNALASPHFTSNHVSSSACAEPWCRPTLPVTHPSSTE